MKNSVELLAKSQLLTLKGETIAGVPGAPDGRQEAPQQHYQVGCVIDQKYKITDLLGEGGMGTVYKAHHLMLGKEVALKTFRSAEMDADYLKRFQREAQAIGQLTHPNIVQVFDYGLGENNLPYYTMECLVGETLADRLAERGRLPLDQTVAIYIQVCQGLSLANKKGIIHRDLKPGNIFLEKSRSGDPLFPRVKIVDFGLAAVTSQSLAGQKLTSTGTIFGSPLYMSPEQSLGLEMSASSDVYSCGCALFETLTGAPPFKGETAFATMLKHQNHPVPILSNGSSEREFPLRLKSLVERMLAKDQKKRFQTFDQVASELEAISQSGPAEEEADVGGGTGEQSMDPQDRYRTNQPTGKIKILLFAIIIAVCGLAVATNLLWLQQPKTLAKILPKEVALPVVSRADDLETPLTLIHEPDHKVAPYLQTPDPARPGWRIFKFPDDTSLGKLRLVWDLGSYTSGSPGQHRKAQGEIPVPPHVHLQLEASKALVERPWLLEGFGKDDLMQLLDSNLTECNDEAVAHISKLTGLHELSLDGTSITDKCVGDLDKLRNLSFLSVNTTNLTGPKVAKLKVLLRLRELHITAMVGAVEVLKCLRGSKNIQTLIINHCRLTDADLDVLTTMPTLEVLHLAENDGITDEGLKTLAKIKDLKQLYIAGTKISPACVDTLMTMKKLKILSLGMALWPEKECDRLKKALPECKVIRKPIEGEAQDTGLEMGKLLGQ